ncbi:hypothetical protein GN244_ATG16557 [Phytophthora infestans]|uniref:Uncharacterized protein n=1 Tax=Phytophthora infestans TaxID=4787 RepID=A0A833SC60_PHYIN|nr:hypothetical protein GN244_ATG16557 [Phytophthora infestans]
MEQDDRSDDNYIVDTEDSEDDEKISGDTKTLRLRHVCSAYLPRLMPRVDRLGRSARVANAKDGRLRGNLSGQSPHQSFINRGHSPHKPVTSKKMCKVMVDEGSKVRSDEKVKQGDAQGMPDSDQEKQDNWHDDQDEYHSDSEGRNNHLTL